MVSTPETDADTSKRNASDTGASNANSSAKVPRRRGRPRSGESEQRRAAVIEAAYAELTESGYEGVTMLKIAQRAGASKETLYRWFGSRQGLLNTMIEENGEQAAARVRAALAGDEDPIETLVGFCTGLLLLLTGDKAVALNRAAMNSPELAEVLLASGRHRVGPIVEQYLTELDRQGVISIEDSAEAFTLLYGLAIRDTQIRVLLGEEPPTAEQANARATTAVETFLGLVSAEER